ncbi:PREDICTED: uncharacterized protein LOC108364193 [Rhagoletis zephyria]|uniref:uncharacterized protein LOC108364193 n=1 Tax=Rhagoletis zephyria TaxID=28612 RepID=UPI000811A6AB|nr:PREDICTED: uncharacterized protein LOC108364193 [Rhagoletis zephyria]
MIADQQENPETRRKMDKRETEKLNEHVQLREGTWNILTTTYKDRNLREALWKEIAGEMKMVPSEIKKQVEQFALLLPDNFKQNEFNKEGTRSFYQATTTNLPFVKVSRTDFAIGGTNNFKFIRSMYASFTVHIFCSIVLLISFPCMTWVLWIPLMKMRTLRHQLLSRNDAVMTIRRILK